MNQKIDGSALASCFKVAASCGKEINALAEALNNLFSEYLSKDKKFSSVNPTMVYRFDDSEWISTDLAYYFPLKLQQISKNRGGRSNDITGYLGYQISMIGDGIAIPKNNEPLIHIFFLEEKISFDKEAYHIFFPNERDTVKHIHKNRLIEWNPEDSDQKAAFYWTFSLRLTSLRSSDDLKRRIVDPAFKLLHDTQHKDILIALPDSIEGVISYPDDASLFCDTENQE